MESRRPQEKLDAIAAIYDASRDFDGVLTGFAWELVGPRLSRAATLEMGCSSGVMTELLARHVPKLEVVDGSRAYIEEVSARVPQSVLFHHSLFEDFTPTSRFDDIVMARALEHLEDPQAVLARARDWLLPGGQLHVMVPNAFSFHRLVGVAMGMLTEPHDLSERDRRFGHRRVYDSALLRSDIEASGFDVVEEAGNMLKFVSNDQMAAFPPALWRGLFEAGKGFPGYCAEIYCRCRVSSSRR
jgi:SAM-dependent methyltransferase